MRIRHLRSAIPAATLALAVAACDEGTQPIAPTPTSDQTTSYLAPGGDRLATIEMEGRTPALYIQNPDGSQRVRIHFDHVSDHVTGNYSPRQLPVTDASIMAMPRAKWSPDGRQLAVIVAPAIDASQVVVMNADGTAMRTVSPNSQYLYGDVEWSPDSRRIAYAMATGAYATKPDLFYTDLGPDRVTRVTTTGTLSGYDSFRFDASGTVLTFTDHVGWAPDGVNFLSRVGRASLGGGAITYGATLLGEPQGIARDGSWALLLRTRTDRTGGRDLVKIALADGAETILANGDLWRAIVLEGDRDAIVMSPDKTGALGFQLQGLDAPGDLRGTLATMPNATWAALVRGTR